MPVRCVLKLGNPQLSLRSAEIDDFHSEHIVNLVKDLQDTMAHYGGAGIAAPQIGVSKRLIIFGFDVNPRYPEAPPVPVTILANPVFEPLTEVMVAGMEGCLSIPSIRGSVLRFRKIKYSGYDLVLLL